MTDHSYTPRDTGQPGKFGRWLSNRPAESWMFFAVGIFLGGFFF
ncbi:MAG: hypothetical protein AAFO57_01435 [Pseudomonadota bacterium]